MGWKPGKKMSKTEIQHIEKVEDKALKRIFNLPITTPYIGLIIKTREWQAEQIIANYNSYNSSKQIIAH